MMILLVVVDIVDLEDGMEEVVVVEGGVWWNSINR